MTSYASEEAAAERAAQLRRIGIWPAVIPQADGRWRPSVDLRGTVRELAAEHGVPERPGAH